MCLTPGPRCPERLLSVPDASEALAQSQHAVPLCGPARPLHPSLASCPWPQPPPPTWVRLDSAAMCQKPLTPPLFPCMALLFVSFITTVSFSLRQTTVGTFLSFWISTRLDSEWSRQGALIVLNCCSHSGQCQLERG